MPHYRWSVDTSNPYPDGAYAGEVGGVVNPSADALLEVGMRLVTRVRVLVVSYDPTLESEGGDYLHEWLPRAEDPKKLATDLANELENASGGAVEIELDILDYWDKWPLRRICTDQSCTTSAEHRYTDAQFVYNYNHGVHPEFVGGSFRYDEMLNESTPRGTIRDRIDSGDIDEVWLFGDGTASWEEGAMGGPPPLIGAPGAPIQGAGTSRQFIAMGFNFERQLAEAMHSYGHRVEDLMWAAFGGYRYPYGQGNSAFDHFVRMHHDYPDQGSVGIIHYPHNGAIPTDRANPGFPEPTKEWRRLGYDWNNRTSQMTDADDWLTYPLMVGDYKSRQCDKWGCGEIGYLRYWFDRLPGHSGETEGVSNNWWALFSRAGCLP